MDELSYPALARFDEAHAQWLCSGTHSVVDVLLEWMAYGKGYRKRALGRATMRWSADHAVLFQNGEAIRVRDIQQTLCGLVRQTEQQLDKLMGGTWARASGGLALDRIQDSMLPLGAGQSFATQAANVWLVPGPRKVLDAMQDQLWNARDGQWRANAVRQWLRQLSLFRQQMLVLVHTWAGQPGRGPEVMTMRHCDTWQVQRNVYVYNGQVMLVTDRDKMKAMRDIGRKVARFLPERVGRMLLAYILWLLPAERLLRRQCALPLPADKDLAYLWRDGISGAWDADRLSTALGRVMQAGVGVSLRVMRYRQVAIELGRQVKGLVVRQHEAAAAGEADDDDEGLEVDPATGEAVLFDGNWNVVWDLQATHGTRIARQHYGVHVGFLGNLPPEMIETYRAISGLWHQFIEKGYEAGTTEAGAAGAAGAGAGAGRASSNTKRKREPDIKQGVRRYQPPHLPSRHDNDGPRVAYNDITYGLQTLFGAAGAWRTVKQEECMRTIVGLGRGQSAICVLPTGAGKSILFLLPAVLPRTGTSIVVVPFVALQHDLVQRAQDIGVDCIAFQSGPAAAERVQRAARLVVVSADVVAGEAFCAYADGLMATGLLQRIFIDECHTVITDVGYRARLGELRSLHRFGRALVLLTATLPPSLEPWLRQEMLVEDAVVVRDRTTKHNVQYRVDVVQPGPTARERLIQRAVEVARELGEGMGEGQKGVLYCRSREQCEAVAEAMGCAAHHSGMTEDARQAVRGPWIEGRGGGAPRWIAATSGLGTGVDVAGIVAVVHVGRPYGLVDFVQQTGRGGRRPGERVQSVVVHDGQAGWVRPDEGHVERVNREAMQAFLATAGCRRTVLGVFLDGVAGETCSGLAGAAWCDHCQGQGSGARSGDGSRPAQGADEASDGSDGDESGEDTQLWTTVGKEEGRREQLVRWWMTEVGEACAACHVTWQQYLELDAHQKRKWSQCDEGMRCQTVADIAVAEAKKAVVYPELACCYRC